MRQAAYLAKDNLAYWQGSSVIYCKKPTFSPVQYTPRGKESVEIPSKHGRRRLIGLWIHVNTENWIEVDGEPMEFEWRDWNPSDSPTLQRSLLKCQNMYESEIKCEPEHFQGRISASCQCFTDIVWGEKGNKEPKWIGNSQTVAVDMCSQISSRSFVVSWVLDQNRQWVRRNLHRFIRKSTNGVLERCRWYYDDYISVKADILFFVDPVLLKEVRFEKQRKILHVIRRTVISVKSAQCLHRSSSGNAVENCPEEISKCSEGYGEARGGW